jgi:hypothetical protein
MTTVSVVYGNLMANKRKCEACGYIYDKHKVQVKACKLEYNITMSKGD